MTRLRASDTYARLLIESDSDATHVDLATDYRMMPALETAELHRGTSPDEIAPLE